MATTTATLLHKASPAPPPESMTLWGKITYQHQCKGTYALVCNGVETGCPVWQHTTNDRWMMRHPSGTWIIQTESNLGRNDVCFMRLCDPTAKFPHHSNVAWEEFDIHRRRWVRAAAFCFEDALAANASACASAPLQAPPVSSRPVRPPPRKTITCGDCLSEPEKAGSRCFACAARR